MKKIYLKTVSLISLLMLSLFVIIFSGKSAVAGGTENLYYAGESGTINLGMAEKSENTDLESKDGYYNYKKYFRNGNKYYKNGEKIDEEVYRREVIKKLDGSGEYRELAYDVYEDRDFYYIEDKKIDKKSGIKVFGNLDEIFQDSYTNYIILKDGKLLEYGEEEINADNIDLKTLEQIGSWYFKDKNGAYYLEYIKQKSKDGDEYKLEFVKLKGIKPEDVKVLGEEYFKDKNSIYYGAKKLNGSDAGSAGILKLNSITEPGIDTLVYDKTGFYFQGEKISDIKTTGKVEKLRGMSFKDEKMIYYLASDFETDKIIVEKEPEIPVNVQMKGLLYEDEKYIYGMNEPIEKKEDFRWIDDGNFYLNNGKIYFVSPFFGVTEQKADPETFRILYDGYGIITEDKNRIYVFMGEVTSWDFKEDEKNLYRLLKDCEKLGNGFFYNHKTKEYLYLNTGYKEQIKKLRGIKKIDKALENGYFIGI